MTSKMVWLFYRRKGKKRCNFSGGRTRTRTLDPLIKSQLLYQLSYAPHAPSRAGRVLYQSNAVLSSKRPPRGQSASVSLRPARGAC
jgi:hypothetical protein